MRADRTRTERPRGDPGTRKPAGADSGHSGGNTRPTGISKSARMPRDQGAKEPGETEPSLTQPPNHAMQQGTQVVLVIVPGSPGPAFRIWVVPAGTPVAAERAVARARTAIQESAGPGTDGAGNTPAGYPAYRADCPGPASTDTASPDSKRE